MARRYSVDSFSVRSLGPFSTQNFPFQSAVSQNWSKDFQTGDVHSEEWTLVGVHKMEKREPFQTWLTDMQANILNCARKINDSLEQHPHPNANLSSDALEHSRFVIDSERERIATEAYCGKQPLYKNAAHFKIAREEEIRLYRGL